MGVVFEAEDLRLGRRVAIKFLSDSLARDPVALERFNREARAVSALNHPFICTLHDIGDADGRPFFVMELLVGESLKQRMRRRAMGWREGVRLAAQLTDALEAAHAQGIVHRDIKPANIFVTERGTAKLLDFGIAKQVSSDDEADLTAVTREGSTVGTAAYMAPEQIRGHQVDARVDIYSLGVVLYELVSGRVPFSGTHLMAVLAAHLTETPTPLAEAVPGTPSWVDAAVSRAMAKAPESRFQSMREFRLALERGLELERDDDEETGPIPVNAVAPVSSTAAASISATPVPRRRRWPGRGVAVALLGVSLVAAGAIGAWLARRPGPGPSVALRATPQVAVFTPVEPTPPALTEGEQAAPPQPGPSGQPASAEPRRPAQVAGDQEEAVEPDSQGDEPVSPRPPVFRAPRPGGDFLPARPPGPPLASPVPHDRVRPTGPRPNRPPLRFERVSLLVPRGEKTREVEVVLLLAGDRVVVEDRKSHAVLKELPYDRIANATFSQSKHPRWKEGAGAAVLVGVFAAPVFFMKSTRHWLTLQADGDFAVLRLDKRNFDVILPAFESRSGIAVQRAAPEEPQRQ